MGRLVLPVLVAVGLILGFLTPATAGAQPGDSTVIVTITAPEGVPANVVLSGKTTQVAAKAPTGTTTSVTLTMAPGVYQVVLPRVIFNGTAYVGQSSRPNVVTTPGQKVTVDVGYVAEPGAQALHATAITQNSVTLTWTAPAGSRFSLRRAPGTVPPATRNDGIDVPTSGTTANDQGLQSGAQYAYSLFTQDQSRWYGPLVVIAGAAPAPGSTQASYIAAPTTLLAKPSDIVSALDTGSGVQLVLQSQVPAPLLGSAIVLPISSALPGGFLGVVKSVSPDGRTIGLEAGGLGDAFDYYELDVPEFSTGGGASPSAGPTGAQAQAGAAATPQPPGKVKIHGDRGNRPAPPGHSSTPPGPASSEAASDNAASVNSVGLVKPVAFTQETPPAEDPSQKPCNLAPLTAKITFDPGISLAGHFKTKIDKYSFFGKDIPVGASVDMALTATVTGAADIEVKEAISCSKTLAKVPFQLSVVPVPMTAVFQAKAGFSIGGEVKVSNLGVTATAGAEVAGTMSAKNGVSFTGKAIANATPLVPKVEVNGVVGFTVGGDVAVGPGAGTPAAGVVAGLYGDLGLLNASAKLNPSCAVVSAKGTLGFGLQAKAYIGGWHVATGKITLEALNKEYPYFTPPWDFPNGCANAAPSAPPSSLLGPGVTKVDDSTVGTAEQWGFVDGFVPGKKAWVLSTGRIADALGAPGDFASTNLGRDGDSELTALSGHPTYDAAAYNVTLVPTGSTLHVRYVFASEEYPEYVGSGFNDVMAVRVNGTNCATVPGSADPVSINTINDHTNSAYYVDNSNGAAGYSTSMDGLTKPLTCSVPVTPGKPVTIQIAVADASDHVYDSAVALIDGGIWTD